MTKDLEKVRSELKKSGVNVLGPHPAPSSDLASVNKFRSICETDKCGNYKKSWTCPPAVGSPDDCVNKLKKFKNAMIITKKFDIDLNDEDGLKSIIVTHQDICRKAKKVFIEEGFNVLALTDGRCCFCTDCSYPEPCIALEEQMPSVSGFGIDMAEYITKCGIEFSFEKTTATLYGLIMYS